MKKYYLTNNSITEIAFFENDDDAFNEAIKRNRQDKTANWKAYNEYGYAIYGLLVY